MFPIINGGWQLAGGHGPVDRDRAIEDMAAFVEAGITTFDCADIYNGVEQLIGDFRRARPDLAPGVRVHTKFVPDLDRLATMTGSDVERIIDRSRQRLGVEALDLVQFHWWDYRTPRYIEFGRELVRLADCGKIRQIGLTNFDSVRVKEFLGTGIPIAAHQVQYSLFDRRPARAMAALGIPLLCYGSLAGGFISERWLGAKEPEEPLENRSLTKYKLIIDEFGGWSLFQDLLKTLSSIGVRHSVPMGAVAIRWVLDQPGVTAVIVGARSRTHLASTLAALPLGLTRSDLSDIGEILSRSTGPPGDVYALERDRQGAHGRIMRYNSNASTPKRT